jgi:hypothetical protein
MRMSKTTGLGLLVLGIVLVGGQLVLSLGAKKASYRVPGETHIMPPDRRSPPMLGLFGAVVILIGGVMVAFGQSDAQENKSVPTERGE